MTARHVSRDAMPPPCPCTTCRALSEALDLDVRARVLVRTIAAKLDRSHGVLTDPPRRRRPVGKPWHSIDDDDA